MYSYNDIKTFAENFDRTDSEQVKTLKAILTQLNFSFKECNCTSLVSDLYTKLCSWLKRNKEMCRYSMQRGILLYTNEHELVCVATLTNELAEKLQQEKPQEFEKYIKLVLPETENETPITDTEISALSEKASKSMGKRKISTNKKNK